jgi:hypothetical protein
MGAAAVPQGPDARDSQRALALAWWTCFEGRVG